MSREISGLTDLVTAKTLNRAYSLKTCRRRRDAPRLFGAVQVFRVRLAAEPTALQAMLRQSAPRPACRPWSTAVRRFRKPVPPMHGDTRYGARIRNSCVRQHLFRDLSRRRHARIRFVPWVTRSLRTRCRGNRDGRVGTAAAPHPGQSGAMSPSARSAWKSASNSRNRPSVTASRIPDMSSW